MSETRAPSRHVWLTPRDLRRDAGPVADLIPSGEGATGRAHYAPRQSWRRIVSLLLAALGAGVAIAAPLLAIGGRPWFALATVMIGALYATALRLALIANGRDAALAHHGRFLPMLARIRVVQVHRRPVVAALRLAHALAAQQGDSEARDAIVANGLRALVPIAAGLWLASGTLAEAVLLTGAALGLGLLAGALVERRTLTAAFRAEVARTRFARAAERFVTIWPTLRTFAVPEAVVRRLHRQSPIAAERGSALATLRASLLFRLAVPAIPIAAMLAAGHWPVQALLGLAVATVAAGQAGAALAVQGVRLGQARRRRDAAARLFPTQAAPAQAIARIDTLELRDLAFRYPGASAPVFEHVDLALRRGEVLALPSPSGSGKTTLLRVITGLAEPGSGQVLVNGQDAGSVRYRQRVAAVFQDEPVGAGTIRAAITGGTSTDLGAAWDAVARVGIDDAIRALPMEMQTLIVEGPFPPSLLQPLLIARALAQRPDLLILDEALGSLPYTRVAQLLDSLREEGVMVIFASHDPQLVALADKVLAFER